MRVAIALLLILLSWLPAQAEEVVHPGFCQLSADPGAYDGKLVRVTATVSYGFEDFTLTDRACKSHVPVWLEYGGKRNSGTIYCCGVGAERTRAEPLIVNGVATSLVEDDNFRRFDEAIHQGRKPQSTLLGRFFSGRKTTLPGGVFWTGYGHLGMYSLLVIQQVIDTGMPAK